jgi:hypothetical protein
VNERNLAQIGLQDGDTSGLTQERLDHAVCIFSDNKARLLVDFSKPGYNLHPLQILAVWNRLLSGRKDFF